MSTMRTTRQGANTPCVAPKPGTLTGYKQHRCRCPLCRRANTEWQRTQRRQVAYGTWHPLVSDEPVREHVATLRASGMGSNRIATLAGVSTSVVAGLVWGRSGRRSTGRISRGVAAKILAVTPSLADGAHIDATGSRRRTQALVAIGYPVGVQGELLGRTPRNHHHVMTSPQVTARLASHIAALYERLSGNPAATSPSATRARNWAARQGWAAPHAWDDIDIDDPNASPDTGEADPDLVDDVLVQKALTGDRASVQALTPTERAAAVQLGLNRGMTVTELAGILRRTNAIIRSLAQKAAA